MRVVTAIVAVVVGLVVMIFFRTAGMKTADLGSVIFQAVGWMSLFVALFSGLFLTADCLSAEKREGTIGFLFLTDLRGYDVVAGKLLSHSLRAVYGLLAIFPVLAIALLMGGVSGLQFWQTNIALVNALVCSLVAGVFISSINRDGQKALAWTFLVLLLFVGAGPLAEQAWDKVPQFSLTSPIYLFAITGAPKSDFWLGLVVCQCIAWTMFAAAAILLPRNWQGSDRPRAEAKGSFGMFWKYGSARRQSALRRRLIERNPIEWIICRERWQALWIWAIALVGALLALWMAWTSRKGDWMTMGLMIWGNVGGLLKLFIYFWVASQATKFFVEGKRTGFIELLLATPLHERDIIRGHWRAFLRLFLAPLLLIATLDVGVTVLQRMEMRNVMASSNVAAAQNAKAIARNNQKSRTTNGVTVNQSTNTTTVTVGGSGTMVNGWSEWFMALSSLAGAVTYLANVIAVSWFGAWMGMTSKDSGMAILKTLLFTVAIPWFCISFVTGILSVLYIFPIFYKYKNAPNAQSSFPMWFPLISVGVTTVLSLGKDAFFIVWSRRKLHRSLREEATKAWAPIVIKPPPIPRALVAAGT